MNLQELIARQKKITELARTQGRELTETERQEFDDLQRQIDEILAQEGEEGAGPSAGGTRGATPPVTGAAGTEESRQAALAERTRIREITGLCSRFGMDPEEYISRGDTLEQVRKAVLDRLERNGAPISVRVNEDEADKKRNAIVDGILLRTGIRVEKPAAGAGDFQGASLRMIAANCLADENGGNSRNYYMMDPNELFNERCCSICEHPDFISLPLVSRFDSVLFNACNNRSLSVESFQFGI